MSGCVLASGKGRLTLHSNQVELVVCWLLVDMEGSGQKHGTPNILLILKPWLRVSVALKLPRATASSRPAKVTQ